jgi:hypothetical protein
MSIILKIIGFVLIFIGVVVVYGARHFVAKYNLDKSTKVEAGMEMDEEQLQHYKNDKAVVNLKMIGMLVALPGFVLIILAFK